MALNTYAVDFESGSSQYAQNTSPSAAVQLTGDLTLEGYIKLESLPATDAAMQFITMRTPADNKATYQFFLQDTTGTLSLRFFHRNSSSATDNIGVNWTPSTGTNYHVAVSITSNAAKFIVDGSQVGTDQNITNTRTHDANADLLLGALAGAPASQYFDGIMDEWRIWNTGRGVTNVNTYKQWKLQGNETNLVGLWNMNEGTGTTLTDATGNNNLTLVNTPTWTTTVPFTNYLDPSPAFFLMF